MSDEDRMIIHLRQPHQLAECAAGKRAGDEKRVVAFSVAVGCAALFIAGKAEAHPIQLQMASIGHIGQPTLAPEDSRVRRAGGHDAGVKCHLLALAGMTVSNLGGDGLAGPGYLFHRSAKNPHIAVVKPLADDRIYLWCDPEAMHIPIGPQVANKSFSLRDR